MDTPERAGPDQKSTSRRIAVVAVHGVADQQPGDTARAVGNLLLSSNQPGSEHEYTPFEEESFRISVSKVETTPVATRQPQTKARQPLMEYRTPSVMRLQALVRKDPQHDAATACATAGTGEHGFLYMQDLLAAHQVRPGQAIFESTVLKSRLTKRKEGGSADHPAEPPCEVHLFEMYWADLSRLSGTAWRVALDVYMFLFYLCRLGRDTLDMALTDHVHWSWTALARVHRAAEVVLVVIVPVLSLCLAGVATFFIPCSLASWLSDSQQSPASALSLAASISIGAGGLLVWRRSKLAPARWAWWIWLPVPTAVLAALLAYWLGQGKVTWLLAGVWWCVCAVVILFLLAAYQRRQPSALFWGPIGVVLASAALFYELLVAQRPVLDAALATIEWIVVLFILAWLCLYVLALLVSVLGYLAIWLGRDRSRPNVASRVVWTAVLSIVLPALFILLINLTLTKALAIVSEPFLPETRHTPIYWLQGPLAKTAIDSAEQTTGFDLRWMPSVSDMNDIPTAGKNLIIAAGLKDAFHFRVFDADGNRVLDKNQSQLADDVPQIAELRSLLGNLQGRTPLSQSDKKSVIAGLTIAGGTRIPPAVTMHALADMAASPVFLLKAGCLLLAGLWCAWALLPSILAEFHSTKEDPVTAAWLGESLSGAFKTLRVPGELIRWVVSFAAPVAIALHIVFQPDYHQWAYGPQLLVVTRWLLYLLGFFLLLTVGVHGSLAWLGLGVRKVLDIVLDVANWLRYHPVDNNPRSQISARYVSLLRHLCNWRDPRDQEGYQAIVIVAHSLGTVITADILRFLHRNLQHRPDGALARLGREIPVYLFTMGCPLRQLLSLRFPHLYDWVEDTQATPWPLTRPDPRELHGVRLWVNGYNAGDYVGRSLWHGDESDRVWTLSEETVARQPKCEFCVGTGSHTRYWDVGGPGIGPKLDWLIHQACCCS